MTSFLKKIFSKNKSIFDEPISAAEQASRDFINMSAREHKKMMKRVIRRASEDQLKILRS
ncbi:MAG: hypothetical protein OXB96_00560 [Candidatus Kaiserbacteria bacterium]|nr:hypothetical protein [Candidatus Kaiserbacteria bacterium]